jgi:aromatic ring hydroxylase
MNLEEIMAAIDRLEEERQAIYADDQVDQNEHPRLREITQELARLWDLRRRIEAARDAGLDHIPVPPPPDPGALIG